MTLLRNDVQLALNDLHRALRYSVDQYRDAAEFLDDSEASAFCDKLAKEREALASEVAAEIRSRGDLPAAPDSDREAGEQLLQRLETLFSADQTREVLERRRDAEREFMQMFEEEELAAMEADCGALKTRCRESVEQALASLAPFLRN